MDREAVVVERISKGNGQEECTVCFMWFREYAIQKQMSSVSLGRGGWEAMDG